MAWTSFVNGRNRGVTTAKSKCPSRKGDRSYSPEREHTKRGTDENGTTEPKKMISMIHCPSWIVPQTACCGSLIRSNLDSVEQRIGPIQRLVSEHASVCICNICAGRLRNTSLDD
jgi:hypothetical protein